MGPPLLLKSLGKGVGQLRRPGHPARHGPHRTARAGLPATGTNLSTSSGAQFGVRGRLVGSVVGLPLSLGYTALTIWIGGDVMVGVLHRLVGLPAGGLSYGIVYALLTAATVTGAVFGYRALLRYTRYVSPSRHT